MLIMCMGFRRLSKLEPERNREGVEDPVGTTGYGMERGKGR